MSTVLAAATPCAPDRKRPLRVMIVDDAIVVRSLLARWVDAEPDMEVIASLRTGREAVDQIEQCDPDVVVLDVDMPELDGISALPLLLQKKRDLVVIMVSTLTRRSAEISLRALVARRHRLYSQAGNDARGDDLGRVPPRTDRKNPHPRPQPVRAARIRRRRRRPATAAARSRPPRAARRKVPRRAEAEPLRCGRSPSPRRACF